MKIKDTKQYCVEGNNVSHVWAVLLQHIVERQNQEIMPVTAIIGGLGSTAATEEPAIRSALDAALLERGLTPIPEVAFTIFPDRIWRLCKGDRNKLYDLYLKALPRWVALHPQQNARGLYFARLIAFGADPRTGKPLQAHAAQPHRLIGGNQLEFIISEHNSRKAVRDSMFQAAIFDPYRDLVSSAQLGFPCLQHVTFAPGADGTLTLNAFYATQRLFNKAYGNFLGLCNLCIFTARQMNLEPGRVVCNIGVEKLGISVRDARSLLSTLDGIDFNIEAWQGK